LLWLAIPLLDPGQDPIVDLSLDPPYRSVADIDGLWEGPFANQLVEQGLANAGGLTDFF
jgi:hypothetical protein